MSSVEQYYQYLEKTPDDKLDDHLYKSLWGSIFNICYYRNEQDPEKKYAPRFEKLISKADALGIEWPNEIVKQGLEISDIIQAEKISFEDVKSILPTNTSETRLHRSGRERASHITLPSIAKNSRASS